MKKILTRIIPENTPVLHAHSLLQRIYAARGIKSPTELDYNLAALLPYQSLMGIEQAVKCLEEAYSLQQNVLIVGDFDADGATSTALAILALKSLGLKNVSYLIPNRFEFGYGLSPEIITVAAKQKPDLIITVDNGINSIAGVAEAKRLGIKVLITDHHLPSEDLPDAAAIINPVQNGDQFLSKNLAGVGVIFYLVIALRAHLRDCGWFEAQNMPVPNLAQFLDLVALGTIADVVKLDYNNRILVNYGLQLIRSGKCRMLIKAMFALGKRKLENISASDLSFFIAPRINAVGRLDDMSIGVEGLLTEDVERARACAKKLDCLNNERREIENEMTLQATRILDNLQMQNDLPLGLCIFEETWHQGVLGVLASRLKDKLNRPIIAFTAINETEIRGSARSIYGVHIREVLDNIAGKNPGLINRFGGHAMAAGLSLDRENYEVFAQIFAEEVAKYAKIANDLSGIIYTDGSLSADCLDITTAELLHNAGPWGEGFSEPLFFNEFILVDQRLVGQKHLKLILRTLATKQEINAIFFNVNPDKWPNFRCVKAKMVYRLDVNEYNGSRTLQLLIEELVQGN
jgi:single-stranded-DNA-specific exonuclease